jgi:TPR repeat protein
MNRLTLILVLTMTVLLVSTGVCWSADLQKGLDAIQRGDFATALKEFRPLAEKGHARAQFYMGLMYVHGQGVIQDNVYAHMWFNIAASTGDKGAIKNRDVAAGMLTTHQIADAQKPARECVAFGL